MLQRKWQSPQQRSHGRHHDRSEAQQSGLVDRFFGRQSFFAFGVQGEINHHDRILLHDPDQEDDADEGNEREIMVREDQGEQGPDAGRRQAGEYRYGMNVTFIKDTQDNVDDDDRRQDQERLAF